MASAIPIMRELRMQLTCFGSATDSRKTSTASLLATIQHQVKEPQHYSVPAHIWVT